LTQSITEVLAAEISVGEISAVEISVRWYMSTAVQRKGHVGSV
jgi:hypothetical protein